MPNMYFPDGLATERFLVKDHAETSDSVRIASILSLFFRGKNSFILKAIYLQSKDFYQCRTNSTKMP